MPDTVVRVVTGEGPMVGPMVIDRVDYVMFTGSTGVGREVAARCGERLIGCSLELGGKNAMIVRADADIARAAEIAVAGVLRQLGPAVHLDGAHLRPRRRLRRVRGGVRRARARHAMTPGIGWSGDMGSLISERQLERVPAARRRCGLARGAGARRGKARPDIGPFFFEPTVLTGVTDDMILCDEETFGPVVSVYPVDSDEEAIRMANDTSYGLNAARDHPRQGGRPHDRGAAACGHGQHQRGLRPVLGQHASAHGRHGRLRARAAARRRGPAQVHRVPDGRHPADPRLRPAVRVERREVDEHAGLGLRAVKAIGLK